MLKGFLNKCLKQRARKNLLKLLESEKTSLLLLGVSKTLAAFEINRLTHDYDAIKGNSLTIDSTRDPIELLTDIATFRECLVDTSYLPATFGGNKLTTQSFDSWYGYKECGIATEKWFPALKQEVAKLAKIVEGAELVSLDEYPYYLRRGNSLISELVALARALLALEAD